MPRSVRGKTAIVTGAGAGINLAFAKLLLENGANVVLADLTVRPESQAVIDQYQDSPRAVFQKTDVTSWAELDSMFKRALAEFGSFDIVCPGAGVFEPPFSNFWFPPGSAESRDSSTGDGYASLDINLVHPIRTTQLAVAHFLASKPAPTASEPKFIIHIASVAAEIATVLFPLYHAAKWGLRGFVGSLASLEQRQGIRVAAVAPGVVKTPLWTDNRDKMKMVTLNDQVMDEDKWVTPEFVAEQMLGLIVEDELVGLKDEKIQVRGGLMLEIGASHIREVPLVSNEALDTSLPGMAVPGAGEAVKETLARVETPGWGL